MTPPGRLSEARRAHLARVALALAHAGLIFALSSWPGSGRLPLVPHLDKLAHGLLFGLLGWLVHEAGPPAARGRTGLVLLSALACAVYGVSDEWHQSFVPGRTVEAGDAVADAVGGLAGAVLAGWRARRRPRPGEPSDAC